ncbi:hypothetical protein BC332_23981 [Capsicum chinense]|nr:hypothetical protein BC332_23981 [Capsicum chinense]
MTLKLPMCRFYSSSFFSCKLPYTTRKLSARWLELKIRNYVSGHVFGKLEVGHVVMNQVQPNMDTMVTQVLIGLTRAIGLRTSNRARLEQYFNFHVFSKDMWLSLPYLYFDEVGVPPITDLLLKIDEIHSRMHRHLDNFQNTLSTCLKKFVDAQVSLSVIACLVDKCETEEDAVLGFASNLDNDNSNSTDNFEIPPAMLEHSVGISSNSIEFTALMVSAGCKCDIDTTMGTDNVEEKVRGRK